MKRSAAPALAVEPVSPRQRSVLTNDPRRLAGVDMRSAAGRRFKDIIETLQRDFGPDTDPARLREIASLRITLEAAQAAALNGDQAMTTEVVRIANLISRRERDLRRVRKPTKQPTFIERLVAEANGAKQ